MNRGGPFFRFHGSRRLLPPPFTSRLRSRPHTMSSSFRILPDSALPRAVLFFAFISISCFLFYGASDSLRFLSFPSVYPVSLPHIFPDIDLVPASNEQNLEMVLKDAAMEDNTVILTTLNEAWATPNSVIDLFLASFRIGEGTRRLLNHLVIIALDQKAYTRCTEVHNHCFALVTEGIDFRKEAYFMTSSYLKMMWRRIDFLRSILEMGYNFVFTERNSERGQFWSPMLLASLIGYFDRRCVHVQLSSNSYVYFKDADVMWFRDPFPQFYSDADFQIACDHFAGSSDSIENKPNGGFSYVKSNNRSIEFYKFWHSSKETYPGNHDQEVLNRIKNDTFVLDLGLKMRFLDTAYFGGLCEPSKDLNLVCTMHANCCLGLESKLHDLKIMLQDWKHFLSLPPSMKTSLVVSWSVPKNCSLESLHHHEYPEGSASVQLEVEE